MHLDLEDGSVKLLVINLKLSLKFKSKKRPISAVADNVEMRNAKKNYCKSSKSQIKFISL